MSGHRALSAGVLLFALVIAAPASAAPPADLLAAYKKEFAFLEAQKRALKKRLAALTSSNASRVKGAEASVNRLQVRLIGLRGSADAAERDLRSAERALPSAEESDRLGDTLERARESVAKWGAKLPKAKDKSTAAQLLRLEQAFRIAAKRLAALGQVTSEEGSFFVASGAKVQGTLVQVGGVATYGVAGSSAGVLAPAGAGRLKLWPKSTASAAKAMAAGQRPDPLPIFLYESREKNVDPKQKKTVMQFVQAGGLIGWVIVSLGAVAVLLIVLRVLILLAAGLRGRSLASRLEGLLTSGRVDEAQRAAQGGGGSLGRVIAATVQNLGASRQAQEDRISEAILREQPRLSRFGAVITVLAAVAPLLGLLGTVTGMISTFDIITEHGTGDPKLLSSGISEALVTTELGLIVAIPTLLVGTLLNGWASGIEGALERDALKLINAHAGAREVRGAESGGSSSPRGDVPGSRRPEDDARDREAGGSLLGEGSPREAGAEA